MQPPIDHPAGDMTVWGHIIALISWLGALIGLLPVLAAVLGAVYYSIQILESTTVQKMLDRRRMRRKAARVARLKAEQKVLVAELEALEVVREARVAAEGKVAKASHEAATQLAVDTANQASHVDGKP